MAALIISPILVFMFFLLFPFLISLFRLNKALANDVSGLEKKRLTVTEEGLLIESESKSVIRKWESIISARSNDNFIYLLLADKTNFIFPKSAFSSESEAINFLGMLQNKIGFPAVFSGRSIFKPFNKPPYTKGLIGLIPVLGAVFGIMFIADGIGKYKDKWLVLIGLGGIAFNACIFLFIFFYFDLGTKFNAGFVPLSQSQLNSVMRDVEFYKLKNGVYPDSLEQLKDDNFNYIIYDPLKEGGDVNKSQEYNYQKVGTHYYLFSSGLDGIPNTKDDFYPQVADADTSKFGLIRKQY